MVSIYSSMNILLLPQPLLITRVSQCLFHLSAQKEVSIIHLNFLTLQTHNIQFSWSSSIWHESLPFSHFFRLPRLLRSRESTRQSHINYHWSGVLCSAMWKARQWEEVSAQNKRQRAFMKLLAISPRRDLYTMDRYARCIPLAAHPENTPQRPMG